MKDLSTNWKGKKLEPLHLSLSGDYSFTNYGYSILRNDLDEHKGLYINFTEIIQYRIQEYRGIDSSNLVLENYHTYMQEKNIDHHNFIKKSSRNVSDDLLDNNFILSLIEKTSDSFKQKFKLYKNKIEYRVVRPSKEDNNPLHRDHWFPYFNNLINIYLPICGSWNNSSLSIVPGSHNWDDKDVTPTFTYGEQKKTVKNGVSYSVPKIKKTTKEINIHRPDIISGDFMIFSPRLIHGGASNGSDQTRFSLELRLTIDE